MLVPRRWLQAQLRAWTLTPTARGARDTCLRVSVLHAVHGPSGGHQCYPLSVPISTPTHTPFHTGSFPVSPGLYLALCTSQRGPETFPYQTVEGCL